MLLSSILLFSIAACLGLFMVVLGVRYHRSSLKLALSHASIGLLALALLMTQIFTGVTDKFNNVAALLFILAIIGGLMLFALREPKQAPPMILVGIHAFMALLGLLLLILGFGF